MSTSRPSVASSSSPSADTTLDVSQSSTSLRKRRKVNRTRNGCLTCRSRRKRCDENKPTCVACDRLQLDCHWPGDELSARQADSQPQIEATLGPLILPPIQPPLDLTVADGGPTAMDDFISVWGKEANPLTESLHPTPTGRLSRPEADNVWMPRMVAEQSLASTQNASLTNSDTSPFIASTRRTNSGAQPTPSIVTDTGWDLLMGGVDFDEATLRLWAANCLTVPTTQSIDPFQSLSDLLQPTQTFTPHTLPHQDPSLPNTTHDIGLVSTANKSSRSHLQSPARTHSPAPISPHHASLLHHYQASLSSLVSCTGDSATSPSAFAAFTKLAEASASSEAGQGLHLSTLAWAGRHMVNQGQIKYETVSEKLGLKGSRIVLARLNAWKDGSEGILSETERLTLLAGALMVIQWKICRGDVWGFEDFRDHLKDLSDSLYRVDSPGAPPDSMPFSFLENLVYHDLLSSFAYLHGPLVPYSVLATFSSCSSDFLHTLTGACFPLFVKMHRIITLRRQQSERLKKRDEEHGDVWSDDELYDVVKAADELEDDLRQEKQNMEAMVRAKPSLSSHRYLHEAFRITALLSLHSFVLREPPCLVRIRLLVRQSLSLLEEMSENKLPGFCSAHWVLFVTGLCCSVDTADDRDAAEEDDEESDEPRGDRKRIERLYDIFNDFTFGNIPRSQRVIQEVWAKNKGGSVYIDWVNVVSELDWQIFLV